MLQDPVVRPISELGPNALEELLPEIPLWVKTPDYERVSFVNCDIINFFFRVFKFFKVYDDGGVTVLLILCVLQIDWLNKFLLDMWPFLDTVFQ